MPASAGALEFGRSIGTRKLAGGTWGDAFLGAVSDHSGIGDVWASRTNRDIVTGNDLGLSEQQQAQLLGSGTGDLFALGLGGRLTGPTKAALTDKGVADAFRDLTGAFKNGLLTFVDDIRGVRAADPSSAFGRNPFAGKSAAEVDELLRARGFRPVGPDPAAGRGAYFHPETGRKYYLDPGGKYRTGTELPHVDVHRMQDGLNLEGAKKKFPLGKSLYE